MSAKKWTFLSNHGHVMVQISKNPEALVRDIAREVGITERRALGILKDLENAGYISIIREGRRNHYKVNPRGRFRHPVEASKPISALLTIFNKKA